MTGSSDYHGARKEQGLGAETTDVRQFDRLLAGVTGRGCRHRSGVKASP